MTPRWFQLAPRLARVGHTSVGVPPSTDTVTSAGPFPEIPSERLSGDQNRMVEKFPGARSLAVGESSRRIQAPGVPFVSAAVYAMERPSGEMAMDTALGWSLWCAAGSIAKWTGARGPRSRVASTIAIARAAIVATAATTHASDAFLAGRWPAGGAATLCEPAS